MPNGHGQITNKEEQGGIPEKRAFLQIYIHGLRHTHASLLILAGENLDAISKHLGHASSDITSRVYAHMLAEVETRITKTISNVLR